MRGIVYKSTGSWYTVKSEAGERYACRIRGKLRIQGITSTNPVAVGDWVLFDVEQRGDETVGVIRAVEARKNYIVRKSVNLSRQTHILAANLDRVFLLVTLHHPVTFTSFIDRFLVTAEAYGIPAVLLFTKMDVYTEADRAAVGRWRALYEGIGYRCLEISAKTEQHIAQLKALMRDATTAFAGHSGAGKSTLINVLEPGLTLKTAALSQHHKQGQHTTTFAQMYDLSFGARIIDTPGIKGFGVVDMAAEELGDYFPEFFRLKSQCKFHNCLHLEEPQCAVKAALAQQQLAQSRYRSYVQLVRGEAGAYRVNPYTNNG